MYQTEIPKSCYLAFSGGKDSAALLAFLLLGRVDVTLLHFNHGTEHALDATTYAVDVAKALSISLCTGTVDPNITRNNMSPEEYFRKQRYAWLDAFKDMPILMAHHLDDNVETYLFSMLNGNQFFIPHRRAHYLRPFVCTLKQDLHSFLFNPGLDHRFSPEAVALLRNPVHDPTNDFTDYKRNYIRHELMPHALHVNPGLCSMVRRKAESHYAEYLSTEFRAFE